MGRRYLYLYTFLGVSIIIFLGGLVGITVSLRYMEKKYITLQLDVNRRQAQSTARIIESQIANGTPKDTVLKRFQQTIQGTEFDRGFLCMFDTQSEKLICHPNKDLVGIMIPPDFVFNIDNRNNIAATLEMKKAGPIAGIFVQGKMRTDIAYLEQVKGTTWRIAAHQNITLMQKELAVIRKNYILGSLILGIILAFAASLIARRISGGYEHQIEEKNNELTLNYKKLSELHEEVRSQKEEIEVQRDIVTEHRDRIAKQNKDILDSINYAQQIQLALLPSRQILDEHLSNYFILYRPKDIVSGDFYWCKRMENIIYLAVADCTGHGVPGAFMSLLGITMLNEIVGQACTCEPSEILNRLNRRVKDAFRQNDKNAVTRDGIDISLVSINLQNNELQFAGAYNSLLIIRDGEILELKADRMPIGFYFKEDRSFTNHKINIDNNDIFYMYSDGFADQIGGESQKKFLSKNFKQFLATIAHKPLSEQQIDLEHILISWIGKGNQIDDITVLGFKLG